MIDSINEIIKSPEVINNITEQWTHHLGMTIIKKTVPLGVIGIIYESRPNVTVDAAVLCLKSGNAVVLKGGSEAINSNKVLVEIMKRSLKKHGLSSDIIALVEDTSRESVNLMMQLDQFIDVLIPRGGQGLIDSVVKNAKIPVIQTGSGVCHVYVDEFADINKALNILINAKCSRPSVCNSCETLLIHKNIAEKFLPLANEALVKANVEIRWNDFEVEFNDLIISIKIVEDLDEAISHIKSYGTKHSDCIVTEDKIRAEKFCKEVDSAIVYVNVSTRFSDGYEFGFGGEIGISNQKLHARGPMGLKELTTYKYLVLGDGQIR